MSSRPTKAAGYRKCTKCKAFKSGGEFSPRKDGKSGLKSQCKECCAGKQAEREAAKVAKEGAEAAAALERLESEFSALRPEDFDVSVGNDGRRDPAAAREKRQEYSRAMGEHAKALRESEGKPENMPPELGTYLGRLAEQEHRFGNRRLARSISLAEAHEVLSIRRFKQAAREYLSDKITPTGYATKKPGGPAKRSVCLLLSDLHLGSELSALDNPMPFRAVEEARRLEYLLRQACDYKPQYRKHSEMVLLLNGDLIEGQLMHDFRDGAPLTEQKMIFWKYFQPFVGTLAQVYPSVRVVCQPGNHGRDKVRHPGRATSRKWDGHETELYMGLREMCSGLRNVTWQIDFRAVSAVDLHGSTLGLTHGDTEVKLGHPDTKAKDNTATFSRVNSTGIYGQRFDAWAIGHFHTPRWHPGSPAVVYNGAMVPPNGYARAAGYIGESCGQFLWEAVEGFPIGDLRFLRVGEQQDNDERLGEIIKPFRFE